MDNPRSESRSSRLQLRPQRQSSKMRKMVQKVVVRVKIEENDSRCGSKKHRSEGPPSDCWSWRKYGQKPIKGSPYPRGYYRCSTSKGCSAKKQVERSRTDASVLLVTYTSSHNHPGPQLPPTGCFVEGGPGKECPETPEPEQESIKDQKTPLNSEDAQDDKIVINKEALAQDYESPSLVVDDEEPLHYPHLFTFSTPKSEEDEEPLCYPHLLNFSTPKSEENDFYYELEELPQTSSFTRDNFFEERILVNPY